MKGKTISEIIRVAGPPTSSSVHADGAQLLEWRARGYHIALRFDSNQICRGESPRTSPRPAAMITEPALVHPRIPLKQSSLPVPLEESAVNIPKQGTTASTPIDGKQSTNAQVQTKSAELSHTSPFVDIWTSPMSTAIQTISETHDDRKLAGAPIQNIPKIPTVDARTDRMQRMAHATGSPPRPSPVMASDDIKQSMMSTVHSPLKELQNNFCNNCGSGLQAKAKFCDSCGEMVTQQAAIREEEQVTPSSGAEDIMRLTQPTVSVNEKGRPETVSCEDCGRELQDVDKFCDACGALVRLEHA